MRINMSKTETDSNSYSKTWELNVYEMNRLPHEIIFDETEIAVSPKILQNELMCPICLDILKQTMTTKECLHRFCHDCIITALRAGNKECPTCRKKLISKRSLRPDPNFDGIIAKIYPNREEYDAIHEKVLEKLNKKHLTQLNGLTNSASKTRRNTISTPSTSNNQTNKNDNNINNIETTSTSSSSSSSSSASSTSSTDSTLNQNQKLTHTNGSSSRLNNELNSNSNDKNSNNNHRGVKRTANTTTNSDDSDLESRTSTEQSSLHFQNDLDEIEIILKPHPTKELLLNSKRFLKTTSNATVNHLSKYLWTRLCVEANGTSNSNLESTSSTNLNENQSTNEEFQLYISSNEKVQSSFQLLGQNLSLEQVIDKYWKLNRPIELFYQQINNLKNGTTSSSLAQNENGNSNHST